MDLVGTIHDRMPLLDPEHYKLWLDSGCAKVPRLLDPLLRPYSAERMSAYPIGTRVNNPKNDAVIRAPVTPCTPCGV